MDIYIEKIAALSIKNKYYFWWLSLIKRASHRPKTRSKAKELFGYVEGHHILPISFNMGGEKEADNLVFLTAKEHIMTHRLMCKFLHGEHKTKSLRAYHCMAYLNNGGQNKRSPSLHQLAKAREAAKEANTGVLKGMSVPKWFKYSDDLTIFEDTLREMVSNNSTDPEIANLYGVSSTAIHNWRNKLGIPKRRWQLRDKKWLEIHYVDKKLSCQQIADIVDCTSTAIQYKLNEFGIEIRNASQRQKNVGRGNNRSSDI